jgi:hypothetical protein
MKSDELFFYLHRFNVLFTSSRTFVAPYVCSDGLSISSQGSSTGKSKSSHL